MSWVAAEPRAPHLVVAAARWDVGDAQESVLKCSGSCPSAGRSHCHFPGSAAGPLPLCDRSLEAEIKHQTLEAQEIRGEECAQPWQFESFNSPGGRRSMCVRSQTCKNKCAELLVSFGKSVSRRGEGSSVSVAGPFCRSNGISETSGCNRYSSALPGERTVTEVLLEIVQLLI